MGQLSAITDYISQLLNQHVGQFTYRGQSMFLSFATIKNISLGRLDRVSGSTLLQTWAMIANPFFSPVIRLRTERGHRGHSTRSFPVHAAPRLLHHVHRRSDKCPSHRLLAGPGSGSWIHSSHRPPCPIGRRIPHHESTGL